ncbi:MAG: PA0069 family radical SAM protein [Acidobacteriota bacterium]
MLGEPLKGRGASANPKNRFERLEVAYDQPLTEGPATSFLKDASRSIIARNDSPDLPFSASINPYRGCEHGCIYCYARPTHEFLGFSAGLDFESRILVKEEAPALLRRELEARSWQPEVLALSGVTDAYQPVERRLEITRRCLEVLVEVRNPVLVVTKNALVARDADYLGELARHGAAAVFLSMATFDSDILRRMEPRTSHPRRRLEAIRQLAEAGVPVGVLVAPIVPGLTDHEIPDILQRAADAGATFARYTLLRLPGAVAPLFDSWLDEHFPGSKDKILNRVRSLRDGRLNDSRFGYRFHAQGPFAEQVRGLFRLGCEKHGFEVGPPALSTAAFRRPGGDQLSLFGDS